MPTRMVPRMDSLALFGTSGKTLITTSVPAAGWLKVGTGLEGGKFADAAGAWRSPVAGEGFSRDPATGRDAPEFAGAGCFESCGVGVFWSPALGWRRETPRPARKAMTAKTATSAGATRLFG